jgi:hypothetical protein
MSLLQMDKVLTAVMCAVNVHKGTGYRLATSISSPLEIILRKLNFAAADAKTASTVIPVELPACHSDATNKVLGSQCHSLESVTTSLDEVGVALPGTGSFEASVTNQVSGPVTVSSQSSVAMIEAIAERDHAHLLNQSDLGGERSAFFGGGSDDEEDDDDDDSDEEIAIREGNYVGDDEVIVSAYLIGYC